MPGVRHYLSVSVGHFNAAFSQLINFRASAALTFLVDIFFLITLYLTVDFLFAHVPRIGPWGRAEYLFFISFMQVLDFAHSAIAAPNFWNFSEELRTGKLDFRLLRPVGSLFDVFTAYFRLSSLVLIVVPLTLLVYYGLQLELSVLSWLLLPVLLCLSFTLTLLLEITVALLMFWTIDGDGVNYIRMQTQRLKRWPDYIYQPVFRRMFTFMIPLLIIGSVPVRFLVDNSAWAELGLLLAANFIFIFVVRAGWNLGLRRYESASS